MILRKYAVSYGAVHWPFKHRFFTLRSALKFAVKHYTTAMVWRYEDGGWRGVPWQAYGN
jgi:hypothetical protein